LKRFATVPLLILTASFFAHASSVTVVGAYSNIVSSGEHAQGTMVQLWRDGDLYFGFFVRAAGLAGDSPIGLLEDLRFDPGRKTLSFKARLSVGLATVDGETWLPTRDIFQFDGSLFSDQITGEIVHADALSPDRPATHESVKLYRVKKEEEAFVANASTYNEWTEWARRLLQARGPKW
jgi:hypothetical protein